MRDGSAAILAQCDGERVLWQGFAGADGAPAMEASRPTISPVEGLVSLWSGELILVTSRASLAGELARFDFSWFIPSLVKHRRLLGEVLLDKVLVHRGLDTLNVLVAGLAIVVIFESLLGALRTYVFSHTTSRVAELLRYR